MKKKILMSVLPSLISSVVYAQSNITLYGIADAVFTYGKDRGNDLMGVDTGGLGGTMLGFRGEENLGGGLKAVFNLEVGYDISTGKSTYMSAEDLNATPGSAVFSRQAWVGLKNSYGQLSLGRQYSPGYFTWDYDSQEGHSFSPLIYLATLSNVSLVAATPARFNNSVAYTGSFESLTLRAIYGFGNKETEKLGSGLGSSAGYKPTDDDRYGLGAFYSSGPLQFAAIYHHLKYDGTYSQIPSYMSGTPTKKPESQDEWFVGAAYNFGLFSLLGSYQKATDVKGVSGYDVDVWQIGSIIPLAGGTFRLAYGQAKLDRADGIIDKKAKPVSYAVSYFYPMSKRTTLYAAYGVVDYDNMKWSYYYNISGNTIGHNNSEDIDNTKIVYLGIDHKF